MQEEEDPEVAARYQSLLVCATREDLDLPTSLDRLGQLIDTAGDLRHGEGITVALDWCNRLMLRQLSPAQRVTLHYFRSNAHGLASDLSGCASDAWEQPELGPHIFHLRAALKLQRNMAESKGMLCPILTNLGNAMRRCGRFTDALAYYDEVIALEPGFAMALGNRGLVLAKYARLVSTPEDRLILFREAHACLSAALKHQLHDNARDGFVRQKDHIEQWAPSSFGQAPAPAPERRIRGNREERAYREWCLEQRLFLHPLNDIGAHPAAASDSLLLSGIVVPITEGPYYIGFFNQMKQEYVTARYFYYQGLTERGPHFSDASVALANTLDYPSYSLSTERIKVAFGRAYGLLDKVAYFLNHYLGLGIRSDRVFFRDLWYEKEYGGPLRLNICRPNNPALRGLFWLSKDLFEKDASSAQVIEPDARGIWEIRRHLEHKYLKLHGREWQPLPEADVAGRALSDTLAHSLRRDAFERKTLALLQLARAAIIYLALTVRIEEHQRSEGRPVDKLVPPSFLDRWDDEWKD